jgi:hypothetical protein
MLTNDFLLPVHRPCLQVNGRIIRKRIHVRIEHVQPSRCREDFLRRRETNDKIKHEAKVAGGETDYREGGYMRVGRGSSCRGCECGRQGGQQMEWQGHEAPLTLRFVSCP